MNITLNDTDKYEVYKNGNLVLKSGDYIDAAIAMLTYDSQEYDLRLSETDEGLKWELWIKTLNGRWTHARSVQDVYTEYYTIALEGICAEITYYLAHGWGFEVGCLD
jgi:hypothetical protein